MLHLVFDQTQKSIPPSKGVCSSYGDFLDHNVTSVNHHKEVWLRGTTLPPPRKLGPLKVSILLKGSLNFQ